LPLLCTWRDRSSLISTVLRHACAALYGGLKAVAVRCSTIQFRMWTRLAFGVLVRIFRELDRVHSSKIPACVRTFDRPVPFKRTLKIPACYLHIAIWQQNRVSVNILEKRCRLILLEWQKKMKKKKTWK
jgi:hypothetical protein